MRVFGLAVVAATGFATVAVAADGRFERSLQMLAPAERLEQLCDYTAMTRIRSESKEFRPDRAIANAMAEPRANGDTLDVAGGAFRSRKKWYALTFVARRANLTVVAFTTVGEEIRSQMGVVRPLAVSAARHIGAAPGPWCRRARAHQISPSSLTNRKQPTTPPGRWSPARWCRGAVDGRAGLSHARRQVARATSHPARR